MVYWGNGGENTMLDRRSLLGAMASVGALTAVARYSAFAAPADDLFIWDNHGGFGYVGPQDMKMLDLWRQAGVGYLSINVGFDAVPWSTTIKAIADYTREIEARSDVVLCATVDDILAARRAGKMALTYDIEGMGALNGDLSMVEIYYRLGVRQMLIAYNLNNDAGGGCHDDDKGLTDFGRAVIAEMNRVGMVVDCAHSGICSGLEAMRLSTRPCIFSHANARALQNHERNITDEQIKAVAKTGGVVGVNGLSRFLAPGSAKLETMAAHIDYIAKLVGPTHVGIGLDCDPTTDGGTPPYDKRFWPTRQYPADQVTSFVQPADLQRLPGLLRGMGYKDPDIEAIMGGNFMRIAKEVWKAPA